MLQWFRQSKLSYYPRRVREHLRRVKNSITPSYDPHQYWSTQLKTFGADLRGPGDMSLSAEENVELYRAAAAQMEAFTKQLSLDWTDQFAEIGPGNGFWMDWLKERGVTDYTAFDITDSVFPLLRQRWPDVMLIRCDVTEKPLAGKFGALFMIGVTQHITDERKFRRAMMHCRNALKPGGHFIVTNRTQPYRVISELEVVRPLHYYTRLFKDFQLTGPVDFGNAKILAFTAPSR
jgi:SAM-dependent methyltransferase